MQQQQKAERSPALDIVRCFALLCVVSVHFFLNTFYYSAHILGVRLYIMTLIRSGAMICVPLFIMLSGYLMCHKEPTLSYFTKIGRTLGTYTLAGIVCVLDMMLYWKQSYSLSEFLASWLNFSLVPYGWYIEMYIGLFLLVPFLNLSYNNIDSQKTKKILLAVLIFLTSLPSITNIFEFSSLQWWSNPASSANYVKTLPSWWVGIYPITYYFLGCYLREYPLKIKRSTNFLLIAAVWLVSGTFTYYRSYGTTFIYGEWTQYYSFFVLVQSVLVFNFLAQGQYAKTGKTTRRILANMSDWCLGAYLLSYIFDAHFYTIMRENMPIATDHLPYFPLVVTAVYVLSLLASGLLNVIQRCLSRGLRVVWNCIKYKLNG